MYGGCNYRHMQTQIDAWNYELVDGCNDGCMVGWNYGKMQQQSDAWMDRCMHGQVGKWVEKLMVCLVYGLNYGWLNTFMDWQIDALMEW